MKGIPMEENKSSVEISLRDLWKIFLRCWWVMLAAAIVFAGACYLFLHVTHKDVYTHLGHARSGRTNGAAGRYHFK